MYTLKEKVTGKLSRFFTDSSNPPPPPRDHQQQARPYSKEGKSASSYFSYIIPSIGFGRSGQDKHEHEFKPIPSLPVRYKGKNLKSREEELDSYVVSNAGKENKETPTKEEKGEIFYDKSSNGSRSSSEVYEEVIDQNSPRNPLSNLMDDSVFINPNLYEFLFSSLPNIVKGCQWIMLYSTSKHGISLRTLIRKSADLSGPCLLIVGDKQGAVFGGLLECPLKPTPKRKYQGTNQTFVFTTIYGQPRLFRPTGANRYYYICMNDSLALGGGGNFALCLDGDLLNGTSGPCETFGNMCLAHSQEFELKNVELWGFTHASQYIT